MEAWQVVLLIVMIALFGYIILLSFVISHGIQFHRRLRYRVVTLAVVLSEKQRLLRQIVNLFKEKSIVFSKDDIELITKMDNLDLESLKKNALPDAIGLLKSAQSRLAYIAQNHHESIQDSSYPEIYASVEENERSIRRGIAGYNMDVVALNYWCSVPAAGWINALFGIRKRQTL